MSDTQTELMLLGNAAPTSITQLSPDAANITDGVITITWPFSASKRSIAFILAEKDILLRRKKGQVRVEFHGAAGRAVSEAHLASGDEVRLSLQDATWISDAEAGPVVGIVGEPLGWQLRFNGRLRLAYKPLDSENFKEIFVDGTEVEEPSSSVMTIPALTADTLSPLTEETVIPIPAIPATPMPNTSSKRSAAASFYEESEEYASPAFLKRARVSWGSLLEGGFDALEKDSVKWSKKRAKKSRFSMPTAGWTYSSRTPSPERDPSPVSADGSENDNQEDHTTTPTQKPTAPNIASSQQLREEQRPISAASAQTPHKTGGMQADWLSRGTADMPLTSGNELSLPSATAASSAPSLASATILHQPVEGLPFEIPHDNPFMHSQSNLDLLAGASELPGSHLLHDEIPIEPLLESAEATDSHHGWHSWAHAPASGSVGTSNPFQPFGSSGSLQRSDRTLATETLHSSHSSSEKTPQRLHGRESSVEASSQGQRHETASMVLGEISQAASVADSARPDTAIELDDSDDEIRTPRDGGEVDGEDYDLRNYDAAQLDDEDGNVDRDSLLSDQGLRSDAEDARRRRMVVEGTESMDVDGEENRSEVETQVGSYEEEEDLGNDPHMPDEDDEMGSDEERAYDRDHGFMEARAGEYDDEEPYDEDGEDAEEEQENEEDEEDDDVESSEVEEDRASGPPAAPAAHRLQPPVPISQAPVFIDLLSDSDDDDRSVPASAAISRTAIKTEAQPPISTAAKAAAESEAESEEASASGSEAESALRAEAELEDEAEPESEEEEAESLVEAPTKPQSQPEIVKPERSAVKFPLSAGEDVLKDMSPALAITDPMDIAQSLELSSQQALSPATSRLDAMETAESPKLSTHGPTAEVEDVADIEKGQGIITEVMQGDEAMIFDIVTKQNEVLITEAQSQEHVDQSISSPTLAKKGIDVQSSDRDILVWDQALDDHKEKGAPEAKADANMEDGLIEANEAVHNVGLEEVGGQKDKEKEVARDLGKAEELIEANRAMTEEVMEEQTDATIEETSSPRNTHVAAPEAQTAGAEQRAEACKAILEEVDVLTQGTASETAIAREDAVAQPAEESTETSTSAKAHKHAAKEPGSPDYNITIDSLRSHCHHPEHSKASTPAKDVEADTERPGPQTEPPKPRTLRRKRRDVTPNPDIASPREMSSSPQQLRHRTPEPTRAPSSSTPSISLSSPAQSDLRNHLTGMLHNTLPETLPLQTLRIHLGKITNIMAVAVCDPRDPIRPKGGPRDYKLELMLTDPTLPPSQVAVAEFYRPHRDSLPTVRKGDVVLLRQVKILSMKGRGFGVRTEDMSAWAVMEKGDEERLAQVKGPPVELTEEEYGFGDELRKWWDGLDEATLGKIEAAGEKVLHALDSPSK